MQRKVRELMHEGVLTCQTSTTIQDAARQMVSHDVSALVVVDEQRHLMGLLSRTDLVKLRLLSKGGKDEWRDRPVTDIMIKKVITVKPDETLGHAAELLMNHHIHRVVVVEDGTDGITPVGILSITDIARDMAE